MSGGLGKLFRRSLHNRAISAFREFGQPLPYDLLQGLLKRLSSSSTHVRDFSLNAFAMARCASAVGRVAFLVLVVAVRSLCGAVYISGGAVPQFAGFQSQPFQTQDLLEDSRWVFRLELWLTQALLVEVEEEGGRRFTFFGHFLLLRGRESGIERQWARFDLRWGLGSSFSSRNCRLCCILSQEEAGEQAPWFRMEVYREGARDGCCFRGRSRCWCLCNHEAAPQVEDGVDSKLLLELGANWEVLCDRP